MQGDFKRSDSCPYFLVSPDGMVLIADTMEKARIADNGHGYKQVQIMRGGKRITRYVHRLVAECFINNPDGLPEVNHKDGNKGNNNADNLEWCTRSENLKHSYKIGIHPNTTPKQQEAARRNAVKARSALRAGWLEWSKTEEAKKCWMKNLEKADRWHKKGA